MADNSNIEFYSPPPPTDVEVDPNNILFIIHREVLLLVFVEML